MIFENAFSQRYINNFEEPPYQQLKGLSSLRNFWEISAMPPNSGKPTKMRISALICFIEGISMILRIQQVKLLQFEVEFARTPHEELKWNSKFSLFERQNAANLKGRGFNCLRGTWYKSWTTHNFTIQQELVERCLKSFSFVFILQVTQFTFVDLLSKIEFCWCKSFRNFWIWNFYFKWFHISEKMSIFDGWPGVE